MQGAMRYQRQKGLMGAIRSGLLSRQVQVEGGGEEQAFWVNGSMCKGVNRQVQHDQGAG